MSISVAEINQIADKFTPKLTAAGALPPGKTIGLDPSSAFEPKTLTREGLMEKWLLALSKSRKRGTTALIDHLLWSLKKPFLPLPYKAWVIELMKDLEALNEANVTTRVIPAGRGLFKQTELSEWDTVSRFACMDSARFAGCCSNDRDYYFTDQIINRAYLIREAYPTKYSAYTTSEQMAPSERSTFTTVRQFLESAKSVDTYLKKGESGICTTFAWAASYPLIDRIMKESRLSGESLLKRVEVVAYTNHIFVIVNRAGAKIARNVTLPSTAEWGTDVFQVDTWLGSLGHPIIYKGIAAWNMQFLTPTKSLFDSKNFTPS